MSQGDWFKNSTRDERRTILIQTPAASWWTRGLRSFTNNHWPSIAVVDSAQLIPWWNFYVGRFISVNFARARNFAENFHGFSVVTRMHVMQHRGAIFPDGKCVKGFLHFRAASKYVAGSLFCILHGNACIRPELDSVRLRYELHTRNGYVDHDPFSFHELGTCDSKWLFPSSFASKLRYRASRWLLSL